MTHGNSKEFLRMKFKIGQTRHDGTEEPVQMSYIPTIHKNEVLR